MTCIVAVFDVTISDITSSLHEDCLHCADVDTRGVEKVTSNKCVTMIMVKWGVKAVIFLISKENICFYAIVTIGIVAILIIDLFVWCRVTGTEIALY